MLLQNEAGNEVKSEVIIIKKWGKYYKLGLLYHSGQVLNSGTIITK